MKCESRISITLPGKVTKWRVMWFGWLVRSGLDELGKSQARRQELLTVNSKAVAQRNQLLSRERVEAAAKELGLYPPSAEQTRRP